MLNPERILRASSDELCTWCGLLDIGNPIEYRWFYSDPETGEWCYSRDVDEGKEAPCPQWDYLRPCRSWEIAHGMRDASAARSDYTTSLDAIWPLQEATILRSEGRGGRGYRYWLKRVLTSNDHNIVLKYVRATAEQRARAVCLARIEELNELVKEDK